MKTKPQRKPVVVKRGNVSVKIYTGNNRVGGKVYDQFTVVYRDGANRKKERFADFDKAKVKAEEVATKLANGENAALRLNASDRDTYVKSLESLKSLNQRLKLVVPISVDAAIADYVTERMRLPDGRTLKEAVDFFLLRNPVSLEQRTVEQVVEELVRAKTTAGRGNLHVSDLESRLGAFASAMQMPIAQVTGAKIQAYLDGMSFSGRTKQNHLRHITALIRFAIRKKYLTKDALEELAAVEKPEALPSETLIFLPHELRAMLYSAPAALIPQLVIGAFCGLRSAELMRLDWAQVNIERRFVEVTAINAKTASRRLVPLCDAAIAWLTPHRKTQGRVAYYSEENKFCGAIVSAVNASRQLDGKSADFRWKKNALRHSFCSYRLASIHDAGKVALEAGNTPTMIFRHYRELVDDVQAKEWFGVVPVTESNIVPMEAKVA